MGRCRGRSLGHRSGMSRDEAHREWRSECGPPRRFRGTMVGEVYRRPGGPPQTNHRPSRFTSVGWLRSPGNSACQGLRATYPTIKNATYFPCPPIAAIQRSRLILPSFSADVGNKKETPKLSPANPHSAAPSLFTRTSPFDYYCRRPAISVGRMGLLLAPLRSGRTAGVGVVKR